MRASTFLSCCSTGLFAISGCDSGGHGDASPDQADDSSPQASRSLMSLLEAQYPDGEYVTVGARDDAIAVASTGNASVDDPATTPVTPGGGLQLAIGFDSPASPVRAVCASFGDPSRAYCVPLSSPNLTVSGDGHSGAVLMPILAPPSFCGDLESICHNIICYEFARTEAGTISRSNINQVAAVCGGCDTPSCQSLLTDCSVGAGECVVDGDCPDQGQVCSDGACVLEGALRFTLRWSAQDDFDLHVVTPLGGEISFTNEAADGGVLDRDNISGGAGSIENVYFTAPPSGTYTYWVRNYSGDVGGTFTLDVYRNGQLATSQSGSLPAAADADSTRYSLGL